MSAFLVLADRLLWWAPWALLPALAVLGRVA